MLPSPWIALNGLWVSVDLELACFGGVSDKVVFVGEAVGVWGGGMLPGVGYRRLRVQRRRERRQRPL